MNNLALLETLLAKPIAFHRIFATVAGGATEGLFLSQAYYWSFRTTLDGEWFYKTQEQWREETALTRREQESARKRLIKLGILEEERKGLPSKLYYKICRSRLYELIEEQASKPCGFQIVQSDKLDGESGKQDSTNSQTVVSDVASNLYTEITSEITFPPTPQGERESKKTFGFEIPKESNPNTHTLLTSQPGTLSQAGDTLMTASVPPLARTDKFFTGKTKSQEKYERWANTAHPALVYDGENTPWLEPPLGTEFVRFNQNFVDWHTAREMQKYHKQDKFQAEGDFKGALRNDPERCASRWTEYHRHMVAHAATAAARVNNGIEITEAEKQKFVKHQRAFTGANAESIDGIDQKILDAARPDQPIPQLESVATVTDEVWDSIASDMEGLESNELNIPEGAESVQAYQEVVKRDDAEHFRKLYEKASAITNTPTKPFKHSDNIKNVISTLAANKGMPEVSREERHKLKEQDSTSRKLLRWNNLLASGLPSVVADVERQAKAQGYQIIDGQVFDVEF